MTPTNTAQPAENPLHKRLGLHAGLTGAVVAAPEGDGNPLLPLPDGIKLLPETAALSSVDGPLDYLHYFARNRNELSQALPSLRDRLASGGSLWIAWIKQESRDRNAVLPGDLNENVIRRMALANGLTVVKAASLDPNWSAIKLIHRKH